MLGPAMDYISTDFDTDSSSHFPSEHGPQKKATDETDHCMHISAAAGVGS